MEIQNNLNRNASQVLVSPRLSKLSTGDGQSDQHIKKGRKTALFKRERYSIGQPLKSTTDDSENFLSLSILRGGSLPQ